MEHLPPVGWAEVATKHDLAALGREIDLRLEAMDARFEALEHRLTSSFRADMNSQTRTIVTWMIAITSSALIGVSALAFGAAGLI